MADTYPTLGLNIDLGQIDATTKKLDELRQTYKDVGKAAVDAGSQATKAGQDQASAYAKAMSQIAAEAQKILTFRTNMLRQEQAEVRAAAAAEAAAIASLTNQRLAAYKAWTQASTTANAQMLSDTLDRITDANQADYLWAQAAIDNQQRVMRAAQEAAAYEAEVAEQAAQARIAAAEAAAAATLEATAQDRASYTNWWAMKADMLAQEEERVAQVAAYEAEVAQQVAAAREAAARQAAAADAEALAQDRTSYENWWAMKMGMYGQEKAAIIANAEALAEEREAANKGTDSARGLAKAHGDLAVKAITAREALVLVREAARGDFSRMAGSLTILSQSVGLLTAKTIPFVLGIGGATLALAAFLGMVEQGAEQQRALQNALKVTNDYAGLTEDSFNAMAAGVQANTNAAIGGVKSVLSEMVSSGQFTSQTIELLATDAERLGALTGQSADKVAEGFKRMGDGVYNYALQFNSQYHALSAAQLQHIYDLEQQGQKEKAEKAFAQELYDYLGHDATENLGTLEKAWRGIKNAVSEAHQAIMNIGKESTIGEQVALLQAEIKQGGVMGTESFYKDSPAELADAQRRLTTLLALQQVQTGATQAQSRYSQTQTAGTEADKYLRSIYARFGGSSDLANQEIANFDAQVTNALKANPSDRMALALKANRGAVIADIRKKYDRTDFIAGRGQASANLGVDTLDAQINKLGGEIMDISANPLSSWAAQISGAMDQARAKFTDTNNAAKQLLAQQYANAAGQKELLTLVLQAEQADAKATLALNQKTAATELQTAAAQQSAAVMDAYYLRGASSAQALSAALQQQNAIQLNATNLQAAADIAAQHGVASIDQISESLQVNFGLSKQYADQVQKQAQAHYDAAAAANAANQAYQIMQATISTRQGLEAATADLEANTAALNGGTLALASYARQVQINQAIAAAKGGLSTAEATGLVDRNQLAQAQKLTAEAERQVRLDAMSTDERNAEVRAQQIMQGLLAQMGTSYDKLDLDTQNRVTAEAKLLAIYEQQRDWIAKLEGSTKDAIEKAFVDSGKLDFSSLGDAVEKELRKAIYDSFLAKPIDIVVNAVLGNFENSLTNALGGAGGSGGGGLLNLLGGGSGGLMSLFGGGNSSSIAGLNAATGGTDVSSLLYGSGSAAMSTSAISSIASVAAPIAIAFTLSQFSSGAAGGLAKMFGMSPDQQAAAKTWGQLGILPGLIAGLLTRQSNDTAAAYFTGQNFTIGGDKPTQATTQTMTQVAQAVQQTIQQLDQLGVNADNVLSAIELGVRDQSKIVLANGQTINTPKNDGAALEAAITKALLQNATYSDPAEKAMVDQALAANESFDQIATAIQNWNTTEQQQTAAVQRLTDSMVQAQQQLAGYLQSLDTSSLSPLSPAEQLNAARDAFYADANKAGSGDSTAMGSLQNDAQTYLSQAQGFFGSSMQYAQIFQTVETMLEQLSSYGFTFDRKTGAVTNGFSVGNAPASGGAPVITSQVDPRQIDQVTGAIDGLGQTLMEFVAGTTASNQQFMAGLASQMSGVNYSALLQGGQIAYA